ncbi:MAG: hypothetical protein IT343_16275 [Candidatus Melainabacteria bacterium]|nr:hypothetical protein [Candidatus Melainabacteria bacterium]
MNIIGMEFATSFYPSTKGALRQAAQDHALNDRIIATSAMTAPDVLEALSRTASPMILELIAGNANCPPSLLNRLAKHHSASVRTAAAENSNMNLETLWQLVQDEDDDVRFSMAENHHMPELVLKALAEDHNPYVACRASKTLERVIESRSVAGETQSWKNFRAAETRKRLMQLVEETGQNPITQVNRFFSNLYNYARAI